MPPLLDEPREPGAFARHWLRDLAEARGGYQQLARTVDMGRGWAEQAQAGAVPTKSTVERITSHLAVGADVDTRAVILDITAFQQAKQFSNQRRVSCRICGGVGRLKIWKKSPTFDPIAQTFEHRSCAGRLAVRCPDCPVGKQDRIVYRSRLGPEGTWIRASDGAILYACKACSAKANIPKARAARLEDIISERADWISHHHRVQWSDADCLLHDWLAAHRIELYAAAGALHGRTHDPNAARIIAALRTEALLRGLGLGDLERGRYERAHAVLPKARAQGVGLKRPGFGRSRVLAVRLTGTFALCRLCGLLVYRSPTFVDQTDRIWHGPCQRAWMYSNKVSKWRRSRQLQTARSVDPAVLPEMPLPPRISFKPSSLFAGYRALAGQMAGQFISDIAREETVTRQSVQQRLAMIINVLPANWELVFGKGSPGSEARQDMFPLPKVGQGQTAAADRMAQLGVATATIRAVTGVA